MEMYAQAYQKYVEKCEEFGIQAIDPIEFICRLTPEQIQSMVNH